MDDTLLKSQIKQDEGSKARVYLDSLGNPTIGWGHKDKNLKTGDWYSLEQRDAWFEKDFKSALHDYESLGLALDPVRRGVLIMMIFNIGLTNLLTWERFLGALRGKNYYQAAYQMGVNSDDDGPSLRRTQLPKRVHREMAAMLTGEWV